MFFAISIYSVEDFAIECSPSTDSCISWHACSGCTRQR